MNGSTLPYIPWDTFMGFVEHLKAVTVPAQIDTSIMPATMSGSNRAGIMTTLRFFKFIDENGTVSKALKDFVAKYGPSSPGDTEWESDWKDTLTQTIFDAFDPVLSGLDVSSATPRQLDDKFDAAGASVQMRQKAIRFFLGGLASAGAGVSPHLLRKRSPQRAPKNGNTPRATKKRKEGASPTKEHTREEEKPETSRQDGDMVPIPLFPPPRRVLIPQDISAAECETVHTMMLAYAKAVKSKSEQG